MADTRVLLRAVVIGRNGQKTLRNARNDGEEEHDDARNDRHRRDCGVAVGSGGIVERRGGEAGKALPRHRGAADPENIIVFARIARHAGQREPGDALAAQEIFIKNDEADALAHERRRPGPRNAHFQGKYQHRSQHYVEQRATQQPAHRINSLTLGAQDVVHYESRTGEGSAEQYVARIIDGVWQDAVRRAKEPHETLNIFYAEERGQRADQDDGKERSGGKTACLRVVAGTETYLYLALRAAAKGITDGVEKGEDGEDDARGGVGAGPQL